MDPIYSNSQSYAMYDHPSWDDESKNPFVPDEHDPTLNDKAPASSGPDSRRPSALKVEDEFSASNASSQMWHDRPHDPRPMRSFSQSHVAMMTGTAQPFMRMNDPAFAAPIPHPHPHQWSVPHSGASTPTPMYGQVYDMSYPHPAPAFSAYPPDPTSAVSMSPQSSQGGWVSTTSSDGADQRSMISPTYRAPSPGSVVRPDGIRKKNARFEIPKERNLANIDAMIMASTDENEKKELKQQKRLLRNRQAALDSRQRKKTHTEKLEQEKKVSEKKMYDLEEGYTRLENSLAMERDDFVRRSQHMDHVITALQYERDEAIRTRTLETAELRRQVSALKDCIRDLERQQNRGYVSASSLNYSNEFNQFDLEDSWDTEFNLMNGDDLKMDDSDQLQRQATPRPPSVTVKPKEQKTDSGFSWNTFYMCLLFGAFIASNNNSNTDTSAIASSISPSEASNVLKTVLSSGGSSGDLALTRSQPIMHDTVTGSSIHPSHLDATLAPSSSLENLRQSLSTPSRHQETAALFSLSAESYQHLTDPFNEGANADSDLIEEPPRPTALQKAFATMQTQKDNMDRLTGMGSRARERSLLWDSVPPEVIKNFEAMVQKSTQVDKSSNRVETMEH